ncbi:MAG: hypothetical protein LUG96_10690 [Tannerellaceae bacterium]|nr:hypothetical protein [Tannerellaceae bacterium]
MRIKRLFIIQFLFISFLGYAQYNIGERTLVYVDETRDRPLITEIWYPTFDKDIEENSKTDLPFILPATIREASFIEQRSPLILLSHGTGGNRFGLAWLATALAEKGYIVAAPDHWGNTFDNIIPEYFLRYWERPLDISFLITQLCTDPILSGQIDPKKIGIAGFSLGGYTSLALAGANLNCSVLMKNAQSENGKKEFEIPKLEGLSNLMEEFSCESVPSISLKDDRIKVFVAMAPALGLGFENLQQTLSIQSLVLIIGAAGDHIAPIQTNAKNYHRLISNAIYKELAHPIGHYIFLSEPVSDLKNQNLIYYNDHHSINRNSIHKEVQQSILNFFDKTLF